MDPKRDFLRHILSTIAYRGGKAVRDVPPGFESVRVCDSARTPAQILAHIGDLLDWGLSISIGKEAWHDSTPLPWEQEVQRFFDALARFEAHLVSDRPLAADPEQIFQGPLADALTHIGQIAMLRRVAASPVKGESYFRADIVAGRIGPDQARPRKEFD